MENTQQTLIAGIRAAAANMQKGEKYMWGHMGACNCGHLAQQLTSIPRAEIHQYAMQRPGDWKEQVLEFCPNTGYPIDLIIEKMLSFGLSREDLMQLEDLSNPRVLERIPQELKPLTRYKRADAILYMEIWADILEEELMVSQHKSIEIQATV